MNGAGKKVWGYYPTDDVWLPLQVDKDGKVVVDLSAVSLGDLGDVRVPAPADQNFLYWDGVAGEWTYRILVDADIPAGIARDAEVNNKIAAIKLDDLADVNVPAPDDFDFLQYDATTSKWIPRKAFSFGSDAPEWQHEMDFFHWTTTVVGTGSVTGQDYGVLKLKSGATAGGTARGRGYKFGFFHYESWDFDWVIRINPRLANDPAVRTWVFIGHDLAANPTYRSIGFRLDQLDLKGMVHDGTNLHIVALMTLTIMTPYVLHLKFRHGDKIEWFVDGVKKGESADIPTAQDSAANYCMFAVSNEAVNANVEMALNWHSWIGEF